MLNCDERFVSQPAIVFAYLFLIEKLQLEQRISLSYVKGRISRVSDNIIKINENDGFAVFQKLKGSDVYWKETRMEMIASLEQLGPFHVFFMLSCADKRWTENFTTILALKGHTISYVSRDDGCDMSTDDDDVYIDDIPLEEFLANIDVHEAVRKHILIVTRNFDQRVKMFKTHILCGKNNPLNVQFYRWRIEFQLRGAAHVHGVLWLDLDKVQAQTDEDNTLVYPNIKSGIMKLQNSEPLSILETESVVRFIDSVCTCSRKNNASKIVESVNWHHHSKSCRKKTNKECRFHYPKFLSEYTIITCPVLETTDSRIINEAKKNLQLVKRVLCSLPTSQESLDQYILENSVNLDWVLRKAAVKKADYYRALSMSLSGNVVVLKRDISEIYINNYNEEWILSWNGNLDLQICLDFFAVITYITDYYSKSETKVSDLLIEACKQNKDASLQTKMLLLAQVFLRHRQMGETEAYRMLPGLHFKDSNIRTIFVKAGFKNNRHKYMFKLDSTTERETGKRNGYIIEGRESLGELVEKTSIHELYENRPPYLKEICLAQFSIMYDCASVVSNKAKFSNGISDTFGEELCHELIHWSLYLNKKLPKYIKITVPEQRYMRLRSYPAILRRHHYNSTLNPQEFTYSELLLFSVQQ